MKKELLILFAKNPELGKVKTRLAATVGEARALEVYRVLLDHTRLISLKLPCDRIVYFSDFIDSSDHWNHQEFQKAIQSKGDLGMRMLKAFHRAFEEQYHKVVIIGSDCYELTPAIIEQAFNYLDKTDVVLGPARDGGYYLLGMKELHSRLFVNKKWSSASVLKDTLNDIDRLGLKAILLPLLSDVDNEEDLVRMGPIPTLSR